LAPSLYPWNWTRIFRGGAWPRESVSYFSRPTPPPHTSRIDSSDASRGKGERGKSSLPSFLFEAFTVAPHTPHRRHPNSVGRSSLARVDGGFSDLLKYGVLRSSLTLPTPTLGNKATTLAAYPSEPSRDAATRRRGLACIVSATTPIRSPLNACRSVSSRSFIENSSSVLAASYFLL
jgi:hypothetical protein